MAINEFYVDVVEDSTPTFLVRLTADDDSAGGKWTKRDGEGYWLKQADITSITVKYFDPNSSTPDTALLELVLTSSSVILDTPVQNRHMWNKDHIGYNFKHKHSDTAFPAGAVTRDVEYKITTTNGGVGFIIFHVTVIPVRSS